jgi:hypothetical protein
VLDILLLIELRLLPRGAEEEGKLLVGDHQRKEGRKEGRKEARKKKCVFWVLWVGLLATSPHNPNGNSHKRRAIVCG